MNRLIIIDGNAILHRAFHAIPPLTDPQGRVVNAVYGFTTMLLRLVTDFHPTHLAVAFDRPKPTFRKQLFADYQAKRPKMDDTLIPQVEIIHQVITAFHIPIFECDGYEADDVIGTIVREMGQEIKRLGDKKTNLSVSQSLNLLPDQIIIVTGDRDILQLVEDEQVLVYMPIKGLTEAKLYEEKDVKERLGIPPNKITDYKGLAGDSSDNYPGVEGIGPKTAVTLIEQYGSVEGIYAAIEDNTIKISEGTLTKLKAGKENALMSKNLATIRQDVPIEIDWEQLKVEDLNNEDAKKILSELHFHSLLKRLEGKPGESKRVESRRVGSRKVESKKVEEIKSEQLSLV